MNASLEGFSHYELELARDALGPDGLAAIEPLREAELAAHAPG